MSAARAFHIAFALSMAFLLTGEARLMTRQRRQTVVSSDAQTSGTADTVQTDAMSQHYKTADGTVGMNVSSTGNATGANAATINNAVNGQVGNTTINAGGNVGSTGTNSQSYSDIFSKIYGNNMTLSNYQQGKGEGIGDTAAMANGGGQMYQNGKPSKYGSDNLTATAGATGSLGSSSEVIAQQDLTWDSILAQLVGSAVAEGLGNAQANVDLGAGNQQNGIEVNGLVSGWNNANGNVNAQVNGNAQMENDKHNLVGNMYGTVNGSSGSQLVGASNLQSNVSGVNNTISMFGDSNVQTDGTSGIGIYSQSDLKDKQGANGDVLMNATANGANKNMTVQNGAKVNDLNGGTLAIGHGSIVGNGTQNSNGNIQVETTYNQTGETQIVSHADGDTISDGGKNSSLQINNQADITNSNGVKNNGSATAGGVAFGEQSNMTGSGHLNISGGQTGGSANMEAFGGGKGPSAAETHANVILNEGGVPRNSSVAGSVNASGDKTQVHSISTVTDYAGIQTLNNYQHATSIANGSSSASASNHAVLRRKRNAQRRKKRFALGALFDRLF